MARADVTASCASVSADFTGGVRYGWLDWMIDAAECAARRPQVAKGQEKPGKKNKPKVSTKDKQAKKVEKKAAAS